MRPLISVHVLAGAVALVAGFAALWTVKGATAHKRLGMVFVCAMLMMCAFGFVLAFRNSVWVVINVPAAVVTAYLVTTSLTTVRPPARGERGLHVAAMLVALAVGPTMLALGVEAVANGGRRNGVPAFPFFLFGVVASLGAWGDVRVLRSGAPRGAARLTCHLWRMCFALFIAAMSFFLGQMKVMPPAMRIPAMLAIPPLAALATMLYWMWKLRRRRATRTLATLGTVPNM